MSEFNHTKESEKQAALKKIIRELHDGVPVDKLKKEFSRLIKSTSPEEIAEMENALIREGFPPQEVQRLCDVHVEVFEQSLKRGGKAGKIPGHPVHTFIQENKEARKILKSLVKTAGKIRRGQPGEKEIQDFTSRFQLFREIEKHYQRKENQLFPLLESKGFTGPTQVMWGKHDDIRGMIKKINGIIRDQDWQVLAREVRGLAAAVKKLIFLEEKILYPTSTRKLNDQDWARIKWGEPEIGYAWVTPGNLWDADLAGAGITRTGEAKEAAEPSPEEPAISLSQGRLTAQQIDLLLKNLPVDITFVDENDRVCYYSDTRERIFPRSPAIIGRTVQNCHPPKSGHIVDDIVKNFKEKKRESAEFWIRMNGQFIHIRYFPLFDEAGAYRGVIEVSQEVSHIRSLEGERRLLDW